MTRTTASSATRLLLIAGALFAFSLPVSAQTASESRQLMGRLDQLDNQVQTLSRAVYRGDAPAASASGTASSAASASGFEQRLGQLEDQQRAMTGQIEKLTFDLQKLKETVERQQADTEQRFQQQQQQPPQPVAAAPTPAPEKPDAASVSGGNFGGNGPGEALYEQAFADIKDTKFAEAETGFKKFLATYPDHPLAANAQYWLGETYYGRADYKQAAKTFAQCYQTYPKSAKASDSLLKLALSLSRLGKKDDACLSLRQLQKDVTDAGNTLRKRGDQEIKSLACP